MKHGYVSRGFNHVGLKMCCGVICIILGITVCDASNVVARVKTDVSANAGTNDFKSIHTSNDRLRAENQSDFVADKVSITIDNLMSGVIGALIVAFLSWLVDLLRRKRERFSLLKAVSSECEFNLSIMDEIAKGIAQGKNGSYKRVKNDFFLELRKISYMYHFHEDLYSSMARVSCDEDVLNSELDALQTTSQNRDVNNVLLRRTALCAVVGVKGSLSNLKTKVDVLSNQLPWSLIFR